MNLAELKEAYKARKLALDSAKKEEEKYKALLKDAMLEAGESDYTDEAGYRFERIVQERKSMDEEKLLGVKDGETDYDFPIYEVHKLDVDGTSNYLNQSIILSFYQFIQIKISANLHLKTSL